jgi:8-oxo-dGTP pyrophosphatase MutT (NUDIX family)
MRSRKDLIDSLKRYRSDFKTEQEFQAQFIQLLQHPRAYFRDHLPGHMTGSTWIIDETCTYVLLTHHAKLNRWLQPGGHADGDEDILNVALREAEEETGLKNFTLLENSFFDIDIHAIPSRQDFPEHLHYDVRFLLQASRQDAYSITEESHALDWKKLSDLAPLVGESESILRMAEKTKNYRDVISTTPNEITTIQKR